MIFHLILNLEYQIIKIINKQNNNTKMKREFTKLMAALALLLFIAPLGMWGQTRTDEVYSTCLFGPDYNSKGVQDYTSTWSAENEGFTWTIVNGNNNNNGWSSVKFGRKNTASVGQIETAAAYNTAISKIALTIDAITASKINSIKLYTSTSGNGSNWSEAGSFTKATGTQTVTLQSPAANLYYKIEFDCASGSSNGLVTISKVEYLYNNTACAAPAFNPAAGKVEAGTEVSISCATAGSTIYYTVNDGDLTEYTANTHIIINEETTIEAYATATGYDDSDVVTAHYTIKGNAVFTNGLYTELMTTADSFENMQVESTKGDATWTYNSSYYCAYINSEYDEVDWLITPKMAVENGKLNISFDIWHKNYDGQLSLKWSASNDVNGTWHDLAFNEGGRSSWNTISNIEIETEDTYIYVAFVYDNTKDEYAGQYEIKAFKARQYYNVTFDANMEGATGTMAAQACAAGIATALTNNAYTVSGKAFNGWNTAADGSGTAYAEGGNITITENTTLYAQWVDAYTVTFKTNGHLETTMEVKQGNSITLPTTVTPAYVPEGYEFMGWYDDSYFSEDTAPTYIASPYTPSGNITLNAVLAEVSGSAASLTKMTSSDTFEDGDNVVIVANENVAMYQATINTSYVNKYTFDNNVATVSANDKNWFTVSAGTNGTWKLGDATNGYVYNSSSNDLKVDTQNSTDFTLAWNNANNKFTLVGNGRWLSYRSDLSNNYFRMGGKTTGDPSGSAYFDIYKYVPGSASYFNYRTSVSVPYTLTIDGYTDVTEGTNNRGYYLIASPVTVDPSTVTGMTTGDFDLYYFDQAQDKEEWRNYEESANSTFNLVPGKGYLYAKKATQEGEIFNFTLEGTPYDGDGMITLDKTDSEVDFQGWNLIGNPYANPAILKDEANTTNVAYFEMNGIGSEIVVGTAGNAIPAMRGVFVIAENDGEKVRFVEQTNLGKLSSQLKLNVVCNRGEVIDRAIVRFDNGNQLPKIQLNPNHTKVYFTKDNKDYAVVRSANEGEMPVSFKAETRGTYTLSFETENVEMNYLHLIDNKTGNDVDLLATPSYTFEASSNDYESRFRLVFNANGIEENASTDSETFAYFNGSEWVINNPSTGSGDNATLQVIDMIGRVLSSETLNGNANITLNQAAGIYMLRLVNGENVKVQKVVVR